MFWFFFSFFFFFFCFGGFCGVGWVVCVFGLAFWLVGLFFFFAEDRLSECSWFPVFLSFVPNLFFPPPPLVRPDTFVFFAFG